MTEKIGLEAVLDLTNWESGVTKYNSSIDKMTTASTKFAADAGKSYADLGKAITTMAAAAATALVAITGATAKATFDWVADGVVKAADLESQISGIAAVMGKTKDEVQPLHALIKDLAIDPSLKVNTFEAADAIELLARNGVEMTDILGGAARNTVLLANATGAEFGTAADIATDVMAIFNIEAKDMQQAVNGITSVVNNSKFDINDYALALARGGVSAEAAGVSFDDFNAIIAYSASAFSSGQTAGTGWANLLTRMVPQSEKAAEAMQELGLITEDGANRFFNADGSAKGLSERIDILNEAFGGLSTEQRTAYAQMIFGRDAANALNSVIGKTGDEFLEFKGVLAQTDAEESAKTRMDNLAGAMEILRGIVESVQISVGEKFLPTLTKLGRALSEILESKSGTLVGLFDGVAEAVAASVDAMIPMIQETLPQLIDNVALVVQWLTEWLTTGEIYNDHVKEMGDGLRGWVETFIEVYRTAQDVGAAVGAFVAVVKEGIAPITDFVAQHVTLKDVLIAAAGAVALFLAPLALAIAKMAAVGAAASLAVSAIRQAWETDLGGIQGFVEETWAKILEIVEVGQQLIVELFESQGSKLGDIYGVAWEGVKDTISTALEAVKLILETALLAVQGDWEGAWEKLKETAGVIWDGIKDVIDNRLELLSTIFGVRLGGMSESVERIWNSLGDIITRVTGVIEGIVKGHGDAVGKHLKAAWDAAVTLIEASLDTVATLLEGVALALEGDWAGAWQKAQEAVETAATGITDAWSTMWESISGFLTDTGGEAVTWFQETFPAASDSLKEALERLGDSLSGLSEAWDGAVTAINETLTTFFAEVEVWWEEHGASVQAIVDAWLALVITIFSAFVETFVAALTAFLLLIQGDWEGAWETLKTAFSDAWENIKTKGLELWEQIRTEFGAEIDQLVEDMKTKAQEAVDGFVDNLKELATKGLTEIESAVADWNAELLQWAEDAKQQAADAVTDFAEELKTLAVKGLTEIQAAITDWIGEIDKFIADMKTKALEAVDKFVEGLKDLATKGVAEIQSAVTKMLEPITGMADKMRQAGIDAAQGFTNGLNSMREAAGNAASNFGRNILNMVGIELETDSPSKAMERIGRWTGEGFVNGLEDTISRVSEVAGRVASTAVQAVQSTMSGVSGLLKRAGGALGFGNEGAEPQSGGMVGQSFFDEMVEAAAKAVQLGADVGTGFVEGMQSTHQAVAEAGGSLAQQALQMLQQLLDASSPSQAAAELGRFTGEGFALGIEESWSQVQTTVEAAFALLLEAMGAGVEAVNELWAGAWDGATEATDAAWVAIGETLQAGVDAVLEAIEQVAEIMAGQWAELWQAATEVAEEATTAIGEMVTELFALITATLEEQGGEATAWFTETFPEAMAATRDALTEFLDAWQEMADAWVDSMQEMVEAIIAALEEMAEAWEEHGQAVVRIVADFMEEVQGATDAFVQDMSQAFDQFLSDLESQWEQSLQAISQEFDARFREILDRARQIFQDLNSLVRQEMETLAATMRQGAENAVSQFVSGLSQLGPQAAAAVQSAMSQVASQVQGLAATMQAAGANAGASFASGLQSSMAAAQSAAASLSSSVSSTMQSALQIYSPSRVTFRFGQMAGEGFTEGLRSMILRARDIALEIAEVTRRAIEAGARQINVGDFGRLQGGPAAAAAGGFAPGGPSLYQQVQATRAPSMMQSYANTYNQATQFGPITIQTPMDVAELEYRFQSHLLAGFGR